MRAQHVGGEVVGGCQGCLCQRGCGLAFTVEHHASIGGDDAGERTEHDLVGELFDGLIGSDVGGSDLGCLVGTERGKAVGQRDVHRSGAVVDEPEVVGVDARTGWPCLGGILVDADAQLIVVFRDDDAQGVPIVAIAEEGLVVARMVGHGAEFGVVAGLTGTFACCLVNVSDGGGGIDGLACLSDIEHGRSLGQCAGCESGHVVDGIAMTIVGLHLHVIDSGLGHGDGLVEVAGIAALVPDFVVEVAAVHVVTEEGMRECFPSSHELVETGVDDGERGVDGVVLACLVELGHALFARDEFPLGIVAVLLGQTVDHVVPIVVGKLGGGVAVEAEIGVGRIAVDGLDVVTAVACIFEDTGEGGAGCHVQEGLVHAVLKDVGKILA